jgi:hypothetical protein
MYLGTIYICAEFQPDWTSNMATIQKQKNRLDKVSLISKKI